MGRGEETPRPVQFASAPWVGFGENEPLTVVLANLVRLWLNSTVNLPLPSSINQGRWHRNTEYGRARDRLVGFFWMRDRADAKSWSGVEGWRILEMQDGEPCRCRPEGLGMTGAGMGVCCIELTQRFILSCGGRTQAHELSRFHRMERFPLCYGGWQELHLDRYLTEMPIGKQQPSHTERVSKSKSVSIRTPDYSIESPSRQHYSLSSYMQVPSSFKWYHF